MLAGPSRRRSRRSLASLSRTCPAPCSSSRCYDGAPRSARRVVPRQRPDSDCECYDMTSASCRDEIARCSSTRTAAEPRRAPTRVPAVSGTQLRPQRTVGGCGGKSSKPGAEPKCSVLASAGSCSGRTLFDSDRWPGGAGFGGGTRRTGGASGNRDWINRRRRRWRSRGSTATQLLLFRRLISRRSTELYSDGAAPDIPGHRALQVNRRQPGDQRHRQRDVPRAYCGPAAFTEAGEQEAASAG